MDEKKVGIDGKEEDIIKSYRNHELELIIVTKKFEEGDVVRIVKKGTQHGKTCVVEGFGVDVSRLKCKMVRRRVTQRQNWC